MSELLKKFKSSIIVHMILGYVFVTSGLIVNFLQLMTLIVWPFDRLLYRKLNCYLNYVFYSNYSFMAQHWSGSTLELYAKKEVAEHFNKENIVICMNHKYDIDWMMGIVAAQNINVLDGVKVMFKNSLRYLPVFGFFWICTENIFLKRNWEEDSKTLIKSLSAVFEFPKDHFFNINIYAEGTRFTEEKHKASVEYAKSKGLPIYKHHLLPRIKGFNLLMQSGRNTIKSIFDCTLVLKTDIGANPTIMMIKDGIPVKGKLYINRIPISEVPIDDETKLTKFLYDMYERKDKIFEELNETGELKSLENVVKLDIKKNNYDLYIVLTWIVLLLPASTIYLAQALWFGSMTLKSIFLLVVCLMYGIINILIVNCTTDLSSSSFGLSKKAK